jgi:hypothetical protein
MKHLDDSFSYRNLHNPLQLSQPFFDSNIFCLHRLYKVELTLCTFDRNNPLFLVNLQPLETTVEHIEAWLYD